ncbi:MAG: HEAT repeat domain-containing protein [Acidobacteriota bacterium]
MPEVTPLSPELVRGVAALARSLVAAARSWSLYPPEHPALHAAIGRLQASLAEAAHEWVLSFGVTPETLLIDGVPAGDDGPVQEAAAWLHDHDIVHITFAGDVPVATLHALLALLSEDIGALRARGGPAQVWLEARHIAITIEQIDFATVFEEREVERPLSDRDDLWRSIVRAVTDRRKILGEAAQRRMLEIAGNVLAIGELALDVMAPNVAADGSPMLTSQAAAVIAAYRHLVSIVDVMEPGRRTEVMQNLTAATSPLDPRIILQMLGAREDPSTGAAGGVTDAEIRSGIAAGLDDFTVAQLLATTLAIEGLASDRLAGVFDTIAADPARQRRVLTLTRTLLTETSFGQTDQFETLWTSMQELLLTYNERPFVSAQYKNGLDQAGARGDAMAGDVPADLLALIETLSQDSVRRLSVTLLVDLLRLESDPTRAPGLARDVAALGEDLLLAGDYASALIVTRALAEQAATAGAVTSEGSRVALDEFVDSAAFDETADALGDVAPGDAACIGDIAVAAGPAAAVALGRRLDVDDLTPTRERATAIIRRFGGAAVDPLAPLLTGPHWYARRNAAELLGQLQAPAAVPLLQPLLRGADPRVMRAAIHTVLRASTGAQREAVVGALVEERDPRVLPVLVRILNESAALGADHQIVIETLGAIGELGGDQAVPHVAAVMRKHSWLARKKTRRLREVSLRTLRRVGTPAATKAVADAVLNGDRMLRKLARAAALAQ